MDRLGPGDPPRIGAYRLLARLGAGGMGRVYLARSDRGRTVAVKLVRRELAAQEEFRARFRQEVRAARQVGGHWTAPVLDADTEAAVPWVATGYVAGPSLQQVVGRDHGALPERSVRILAAGLAHALKDIHAAGIVHRDLKPSNVLVTIDGPRVIDFGIARAMETVTDGGLTRTGALVGSPGFMAPEQVRGDRVTPACDVFCLGSVLAYAATGNLPFGGADSGVHALMFRIAQEEPDLDGVPEGIADVVRHCLRKDPAARPTLDDILQRTGAEDTVTGGRSRDPWLPGGLVAQLGRHAVQLLETEDPEGADADRGVSPEHASAADESAPAATGQRQPGSQPPDRMPTVAASQSPAPPAPPHPAYGDPQPGQGHRQQSQAQGAAQASALPLAYGDPRPGQGHPQQSQGQGAAQASALPLAYGDPRPGQGHPQQSQGQGAAQASAPAPAYGDPQQGQGHRQQAQAQGAAQGSALPLAYGDPRPGQGHPQQSQGQGAAQAPAPAPAYGDPRPGQGHPQQSQGQGAAQAPAPPPPYVPAYGPPNGGAPAGGAYPNGPYAAAPQAPGPYANGPYGGLGPTPPYGPPAVVASEEPPRRSGRATAALVAMAVVVALAAGGTVYALMDGNESPQAGPTASAPGGSTAPATTPEASTTAPEPSPSASSTPAEGVIPDGYLGTWTTTIDNASGQHTRRLTLQQGEVGDTVLSLVADGPAEGGGSYHCVFQAQLAEEPGADGPVRVGPSTVTVGEPATACTPGAATEVTLLPDGGLQRVNGTTGEKLTYRRP
ncbi:protein kinase [Streptomyces spinoverrucosus]|uniref:serine/threonine-protein kinase n=1 Tax=Streptomyces spinoverrucosus TaxID=284043 RepID=UPI0018C428BA|nr:serine/threonine-protein kinase [Streptomyces spinoverrucosus]MBG0853590.1 protein kinase [Streptomyces spinoverrucosus]